MNFSKNKILILVFTLATSVAIAIWMYFTQSAVDDSIHYEFARNFYLKNLDWSVEDPYIVFQLRRGGEPSGVLLINDSPPHVLEGNKIFRYNIADQTLTKSSRAEWNSFQGQTTYCPDSEKNSAKKTREFGVIFEDKEISTIARYPFALKSSFSGDRYAVISIEGPINYSRIVIIPTLPGERSEVLGKRYLEIFSMPDGKRVKQPIEITVPKENPSIDMCWSADDRFLVIRKNNLVLQIVDVDKMPPDR